MKGYINIYRSGIFHREGKPGAFNRHPGDIYPDKETAIADIEPRSHYVTTVPIEWEETDCAGCEANPPTSEPVPLAITRNQAGYKTPEAVLRAEAYADRMLKAIEANDAMMVGVG